MHICVHPIRTYHVAQVNSHNLTKMKKKKIFHYISWKLRYNLALHKIFILLSNCVQHILMVFLLNEWMKEKKKIFRFVASHLFVCFCFAKFNVILGRAWTTDSAKANETTNYDPNQFIIKHARHHISPHDARKTIRWLLKTMRDSSSSVIDLCVWFFFGGTYVYVRM